ncbi:MAG: benzoate/H(+) symporter BenE family transporter, partial [Beijerinckiaceae bacterium]
MPVVERPAHAPAGWRSFLADFGALYAANGFMGFIFAATGPVAIILSVGTRGNLTEAQLISWIFGVFLINGLMTILLSWRYRTPLCFFWTIPGTVLVGPALAHLSFAEVIGAFYVTGLLIFVLGASGWVKRVMEMVPMPIVMGMVAGVFLRFCVDIVRALHGDFAIAGPMIVVFVALSAMPQLGRRIPPLIAALIIGACASVVLGRFSGAGLGGLALAMPEWTAPAWSLTALVELVIPLAITVLVVQNGQGFAVLTQAGHQPPMNAVTLACGAGSLLAAATGAVSSCLTGATNALIVSSGETPRQYTGAIFTGMLAVLFGLVAPLFTRFMLAAPKEFIMMLGGLAMLRVLQ